MALKKIELTADLAQVSMVDAATAAAVGGMSVSWWLAQVQNGHAPKPVLRATRCTRWMAVSVAAFYRGLTQDGLAPDRVERLAASAKRASDAALTARQSRPAASAKGRPPVASARQAATALKGVV